MCITEAAHHLFAASTGAGGIARNWLALGGVAMILIALGFWSWRGGVKAALVLLLFEGVLRKYFIPAAGELNYAVKDLLLAGAYLRFFLAPDEAVRQSGFRIGAPLRNFILLAVGVVSLSAFHPNLGSPWLSLFGLAIYFFYLPLVVMMPNLFSSLEDLRRNLVRYALLALPICCFGIYQWWVPEPNYFSSYASGIPFHRVTSTFSYSTGHRAFVELFFVLHLGLLGLSQPTWVRSVLLVNFGLLVTNGWLSASRSTVLGLILWTV